MLICYYYIFVKINNIINENIILNYNYFTDCIHIRI